MIDWQVANAVVDELDLDALPACPLCLMDLAVALHERRPQIEIAALLPRTCDWVWLEISTDVRAGLARLRMRGVPHADEAVRDVKLNNWEGRVARVIVTRLARRIADELDERFPPPEEATVLPLVH